ncbi:antitoxin VapB family protein [Ferroplasma sp.]|uniref:antitoxin VapB family protein n=1 Tax=Ferroplasma sp. TaxID=2591003 RepID=UPI00345C5DE7
MGSKNISISDEAYLRLSELKLKNESFTEMIYRLTNKTNVLDLKVIIKSVQTYVNSRCTLFSSLRFRLFYLPLQYSCMQLLFLQLIHHNSCV